MEDAATAEISRAQLWQWIHHKAKLMDGRKDGLGSFASSNLMWRATLDTLDFMVLSSADYGGGWFTVV